VNLFAGPGTVHSKLSLVGEDLPLPAGRHPPGQSAVGVPTAVGTTAHNPKKCDNLKCAPLAGYGEYCVSLFFYNFTSTAQSDDDRR
jgi:hypothetical protein